MARSNYGYGNMMDRAIQIQAMKDARENRKSQMEEEDEENVRMKNAMYAENAAANAFGGGRRGMNMRLQPEGLAVRDVMNKDGSISGEPYYQERKWVPDGQDNLGLNIPDTWQGLAEYQSADDDVAKTEAFDKAQDQVDQIETLSKQNIELDNQRKSNVLAALLRSSFRNNGMSDRSLSEYATRELKQPVYGVQRLSGLSGKEQALNGSYAIFGQKQNPDGSAGFGIIGLVDPKTAYKTMQGLGAGSRDIDLMKQLWQDGGFDSYTADQQQQMGVRSPNAPTVVGQTNISGNISRRLFGERNWRPSGITTTGFSSDGVGGTTTWKKHWDSGLELSEDNGTRDPSYQGKWKVRQSGPEGTVYDNDKTGESVTVKQGENLRDVLSNNAKNSKNGKDSLTFDQQRELKQMELDAKNKNSQHVQKSENSAAVLKSINDALGSLDEGRDKDGNLTEEQQKQYDNLVKYRDAILKRIAAEEEKGGAAATGEETEAERVARIRKEREMRAARKAAGNAEEDADEPIDDDSDYESDEDDSVENDDYELTDSEIKKYIRGSKQYKSWVETYGKDDAEKDYIPKAMKKFREQREKQKKEKQAKNKKS